MFVGSSRAAAVAHLLGIAATASAGNLTHEILRQLPSGYSVLSSTTSTIGGRQFLLLALHSRNELPSERYITSEDGAPDRPLLIFERDQNGRYVLVGRNDKVVAAADAAGAAGNGCDPFEDKDITVQGSYFTIENRVSCGAHWTDYITFRFEPHVGAFVFDNERFTSWKLNSSNAPNAEQLVPDVQRVLRARKGRFVTFSKWLPSN